MTNYTHKTITKNCEICNIEFKGIRNNVRFCSPVCRKESNYKLMVKESHEKFPDGSDYVECKVCTMRVDNLSTHLRYQHLELGFEGYKKLYPNVRMTSNKLNKKFSDASKGENNVWYNHGGKFSPYSSKFTQYSDLTEEEKEIKARETIMKGIANRDGESGKSTQVKLDYWIKKGFSEEEAIKLRKDRQTTFSLEKLIVKHGLEEGTRKWKERQEKWQNTLTSKSQEEIDDINRRKFKSVHHSAVSQKLFDSLNIDKAYYATNYREKRLKLSSGRHVSLDFVFGDKVIEFNGDLWHGNPAIFKEDDKPIERLFKNRNQTAKELWERDAIRHKQIEELGYKILVVWEKDYRENPEGVKAICLQFLKS